MVIAASDSARAQPDAKVLLDYREGAPCGGAQAFIAQVAMRSHVKLITSGEATRSIVVQIEPRAGRMAGRVEVHEADGTTTERSVTGASCDDVISAVGLVSAVALGALNANASNANGNANANGNGNGNANANGNGNGNANANGNGNANANDAHTGESEDDNAQTLAPSRRRWSVGAGADVEMVFGVSPTAMVAVPVFLELTRALNDHLALGGALRFARAGETSLSSTGDGADFTWTAGALDLCFVWRASRFRLHACSRSHFGAIDAHGEGLTPTRSATRPWVDLSAALAARLRVVGPLFVEASGSVGVPLVRDRFFLEPDQTVFQASALVGQAGLGLGFEIW